MNIQEATSSYEAWLGRHLTLVPADIEKKHGRMAASPFLHLRATFYRWAQRFPEVCLNLASAPTVLSVGDLHIENFGTWRDAEGRLVWGVNDFDEAYPLPYTSDLVRLVVSALLAAEEIPLSLTPAGVCDPILAGYVEGVKTGGGPFVLAEENLELRKIASGQLRDPMRFWEDMDELKPPKKKVPPGARRMLEDLLPDRDLPYRIRRSSKGNGSLGRQRFVALSEWCGGHIAREVKAQAPSGAVWALREAGRRPKQGPFYRRILTRALRCPDPFVQISEDWVARRLAPDCSRIELSLLPQTLDETILLRSMGFETANIHLGMTGAAVDLRRDLQRRPQGWLLEASRKMLEASKQDWQDWKGSWSDRPRN